MASLASQYQQAEMPHLTVVWARLTDVEEQVYDEVQIHLLIVKAVVVHLKKLLVLRAQLRTV